MITVLVTGANGQLGRCLQDVAKKTKAVHWDFKMSSELDITNEANIRSAFKKRNYGYVVNCAAYTAVDKAEEEKEKAFLINAETVKYLAEACKDHHATLIHISTDFVFDGEKRTPYTEEDIPNPINVYGASKLKGERYIQEGLSDYFIIRTSWLYSEYGNNFVKTMLRLAEERNEISVVNDQIGSPTYAGDLAKFIAYLIINKKKEYGIFNYSNRGSISWCEFAVSIFKISKVKMTVQPILSKHYVSPAERPKQSVLDKIKSKDFLSIKIPHWESSLKKCLKLMT